MLDGDPAPPQQKGTSPHFLAHFALAWSPISATDELLFVDATRFDSFEN